MKPVHGLYAVIALAAVVVTIRSCGGEERAIAKRLDTLESLIERDDAERALATADKARRVGELFTDDFTIRLEPFGQVITDRSTLLRSFAAYRSRYDRIAVRFDDVETALAPGERTASTAATATATGRASGGAAARDVFRLTFAWAQADGEWRLREVVLVEVLEGLDAYF